MEAATPLETQTPLERAVEILGGQAATGRVLQVSQGLVWQWLNNRLPLPPAHAPVLEAATRARGAAVTCEELLPGFTWMRNGEGVTGYVVKLPDRGRGEEPAIGSN